MSRQKEFIISIADSARSMANKYNLYASVMIAQACLESGFGNSGLSDPPFYNLFGIKGNYKGKSVMMKTAEQHADGTVYYVDAAFRQYPSYAESFEDNAQLLRNGLTWNKEFYKGTWKEHAKSYADATAWLQGRYATDVRYASKLNGIIQSYNLTQYDTIAVNKQTEGVINMSGTFKANDLIYVYDEPKVKYPKYIATYKKGESLKYDKAHVKNGYVWLEYTRSVGGKGYIPIIPTEGQLWGTLT